MCRFHLTFLGLHGLLGCMWLHVRGGPHLHPPRTPVQPPHTPRFLHRHLQHPAEFHTAVGKGREGRPSPRPRPCQYPPRPCSPNAPCNPQPQPTTPRSPITHVGRWGVCGTPAPYLPHTKITPHTCKPPSPHLITPQTCNPPPPHLNHPTHTPAASC